MGGRQLFAHAYYARRAPDDPKADSAAGSEQLVKQTIVAKRKWHNMVFILPCAPHAQKSSTWNPGAHETTLLQIAGAHLHPVDAGVDENQVALMEGRLTWLIHIISATPRASASAESQVCIWASFMSLHARSGLPPLCYRGC